MSVILQVVVFNPDFWIGLFSTALREAFGEQFGKAIGNFLFDPIKINTGLFGGW